MKLFGKKPSRGLSADTSARDEHKIDKNHKIIDYIYVTREIVDNSPGPSWVVPVLYLRCAKTKRGADLLTYRPYKFWRLQGPVPLDEKKGESQNDPSQGNTETIKTFNPEFVGKRLPPTHKNVVVYAVKPEEKLSSKDLKEKNPAQFLLLSPALRRMNIAVEEKSKDRKIPLTYEALLESWLESIPAEFLKQGLKLKEP